MQLPVKEDVWDRWRLPALVVAVFLIVVVPALLQLETAHENERAAAWVGHSQEVRETAQRLEAALRDVESAAMMRSHGVDRPVTRQRMSEGRTEAQKALQRLIALTHDNPEQQLRLGRLQSTINRRLKAADRIAVTQDPAEVHELIIEMISDAPVRAAIQGLQGEEDRLLALRKQEAAHQRLRSTVLGWGALVVQLLLLCAVIWALQLQIRRRLAAESASVRASARAAAVLQTVREPIVLLDAQQHIVLHNAAFAELYSLEDVPPQMSLDEVGQGAWQDPVIRQRLADVLLRGRELWDYEHEQKMADGLTRTMLINARRMPLPDADDEVVLMTVSDVSLQKASQQRIQELNRQLEGKVEQVSEVNRELEAFSYSVSHDLRAPLRHVAGFSDKLARHLGEKADEKSLHYMEVISSSARRMASLIDDLLVYSRLGRSALRMQAVDMQSVVDETRSIVESNVQAEPGGADRRLEWQIAPLPILVADENMMRQLWMNLLGNAVKYSAKREVARIEVGHEALSDGSHHFYVRDNGAGFDMAYAGKLFGVFQRLHKASEYAGTGIGLASVRRVLARHGGRVWAEAEVDHGATFHFTLPSALEAPTKESVA